MLNQQEQEQIKKMFEEIEKHNGNIKEAALSYQRTIPDFVTKKAEQIKKYIDQCEEFEDEIKIDGIEFNNDNGYITITVSIPYTWCEYDYPCNLSSEEIYNALLCDIKDTLESMTMDIDSYINDITKRLKVLETQKRAENKEENGNVK